MCGRFSLTTPVEGIRRLFGFSQIPNLPARYNIAPTQAVLNVRAGGRRDADGTDPGTLRDAFLARWGLIPSWAKDPSIGAKMINARSETVTEKPAFKAAFRRRRCLIPADSFYEWKTEDGKKQAYRISFEDAEPFAFAALWEDWLGADGSEVESCTILTTLAAAEIEQIHHRMPVILDQEGHEAWLNGEADQVQELMRPYVGPRRLVHQKISNRVNSVRNDGPELWEPAEVTAGPDGQQDRSKEVEKGHAEKGKGQLSLF